MIATAANRRIAAPHRAIVMAIPLAKPLITNSTIASRMYQTPRRSTVFNLQLPSAAQRSQPADRTPTP